MNERAFNLFTALLALILIVLTSILVSSMVQSESNTKTIIAGILSQSRLESMSRLIRADAFQAFNYMTREQMESWLSAPSNVFEIDYGKWADWQSVVDEFANEKFRNANAFADYFANNLPSMVAQSNDPYAGYEISVEFDKKTFKKILVKVLEQSAQDRDFFQIIDCDGMPENCPNGSFYLNLKFSKLDQSMYEQMPLVTVKDKRGNTSSSDPIIPKNDLKVYMPTRIFKALAITRSFMHSKLDSGSSGMNTASDYGYYSPRIQNEIDSMALGYCDYGYCSPRQSPYFPPDTMYDGTKNCPGFITAGSAPIQVDGTFRGANFSYKAGNDDDTKEEMKKLLRQRLCELSRELLGAYNIPENANNFGVEGEGFFNGDPTKPCYVTVADGDIGVESVPSKGIKTGNDEIDKPNTYPFTDEPNNPSESWAPCPYPYNLPTENHRTGMFLEGGEIKIKDYEAASCFDAEDTGRLGDMSCTQITAVKLIITYVEKDQNYKVMKDRPVKIKISTSDHGYTPFNAKIDLGESYPMDSRCAFSGSVAGTGTCGNKEGWMCYTPTVAEGCYPSKNA
ncbi:MAG: hypothetical protein V1493_01905 [Candidatus Diapherotrites archaeon]